MPLRRPRMEAATTPSTLAVLAQFERFAADSRESLEFRLENAEQRVQVDRLDKVLVEAGSP